MKKPLLDKDSFRKQSPDFRIGAVISDGMWYNQKKWKKKSKATDSEISEWVDEHLKDGSLLKSDTNDASYRFPLKSIKNWYKEYNIQLGTQLVDFTFPPRIWDEQTEVEGFLKAPLREIGIVTFNCSKNVMEKIKENLLGAALIREIEPGKYKAYCLSSDYAKGIIKNTMSEFNESDTGKIYARSRSNRRELVDFSPAFSKNIIVFYKDFAKRLVENEMDTIRIFIPEKFDQESQIMMWVIEALEKYDEKAAVPFSGYLNSVLKRWPYNLPYLNFGKDLSTFQRDRSKVIKQLKSNKEIVTNEKIAQLMNMDIDTFRRFDEKNNVWKSTKSATSLIWEDDSSEEKVGQNIFVSKRDDNQDSVNILRANKMSYAIIKSALESEDYEGAFSVIAQMDSNEIDVSKLKDLSDIFIQSLGMNLGL